MDLIKRLLSYLLICTYFSVFVYVPPTYAENPDSPNFVCGLDTNNNGYLGDEGEYVQCKISSNSHSVNANASCPTGYVMITGGCVKYEYTSPTAACPEGAFIQNGRCVTQSELKPTQSCTAISGSVYNATRGKCQAPTVGAPCGSISSGTFSQLPGVQFMRAGNDSACVVFYDASFICTVGSVNGDTCQTDYGPVSSTCPNGSIVQNGKCVTTSQATATYTCPYSGSTYDSRIGKCASGTIQMDGAGACGGMIRSSPYNSWVGANIEQRGGGGISLCRVVYPATLGCSTGTLSGTTCNIVTEYASVQSTCPNGYTPEDGQCKKTTSADTQYSCEKGTLNGTKCEWSTSENYCPIGASDACINGGGGASCSPNACIDITVNTPVDEGNIDGKTLVDDGEKSEEGVCLDQVYIFSGRASDCKLAGVSTAYKNCCKSEGKVYTDDVGPAVSILQAASTVKKIYGAAAEAYEYYSVAMTATADTAVASSMAADAFANYMMAAFNPATIAIAIAIHFIMEYLMKACDQMSMETAMEAASGMCHEVGTYCKKKVPLLGCVQEAKSYCCYNSILARIIQEQGRPQLTTFNGWGTPESPQCRGFTPEEFSSLDFAKIDLSEYVESMVTAATSEIQGQVKTITEDFYNKTN